MLVMPPSVSSSHSSSDLLRKKHREMISGPVDSSLELVLHHLLLLKYYPPSVRTRKKSREISDLVSKKDLFVRFAGDAVGGAVMGSGLFRKKGFKGSYADAGKSAKPLMLELLGIGHALSSPSQSFEYKTEHDRDGRFGETNW